MTWKPDRHTLERKKGEHSDSVREARAVFLSLILDLYPSVAEDLWNKAFFDFSFAVAHRFKTELLAEQAQTMKSGQEVLSCLLLEAMKRQGAESSKLSEEIAVGVTFGSFREINSDQLESIFPNWASLMNLEETASVSKAVHEWSIHWNLDADWCRDHALNVLCEWVADEHLKWVFLSPSTRTQLERKGWRRAVTATIWNVQWSRVRDALNIFDGDLNPFEFHWRGSVFEAPAWNYLKDKEADWRRRIRVRFNIWVSEMELERIGPLKEEGALEELTAGEIDSQLAWRNGALSKFNSSVRDYLRRRKVAREAVRSDHDLVEVDEKPKLLPHIEWAVKYQLGGQSLSQIGSTVRGSAGGVEPSTVSRAVEEVLSLIGLKKRPDAKPGRSLGRKGKRPQILRNLGR